jgi:hypothetical protein
VKTLAILLGCLWTYDLVEGARPLPPTVLPTSAGRSEAPAPVMLAAAAFPSRALPRAWTPIPADVWAERPALFPRRVLPASWTPLPRDVFALPRLPANVWAATKPPSPPRTAPAVGDATARPGRTSPPPAVRPAPPQLHVMADIAGGRWQHADYGFLKDWINRRNMDLNRQWAEQQRQQWHAAPPSVICGPFG